MRNLSSILDSVKPKSLHKIKGEVVDQPQSSSQKNVMPTLGPSYNSQQYDSEVDLREIFVALWQGKVWIIASSTLFAVIAVCYALTTQEWWSAKAKVMQPQLYDFAQYQQQVKQFQPIFDVYQDDGTVLVSEELDALVDSKTLFQQFINAFNSSVNKILFLNHNTEFQKIVQQLNIEEDADENESTGNRYSKWLDRISIKPIDKKQNDKYEISLQATTKSNSYVLLNEYLESIKSIVFNSSLNNLQAMVRSKRNELVKQKVILERQANNRLEVEIERSQYALQIAKSAEVQKPLPSLGDKEIFAINLGSKALEAKIEALKSVKNLSVMEPRLQQVDAKLDMLANIKIARNIQFQTFRFIENVEQPKSRDNPKRALIAVLGALFGGMLGVIIVLLRYVFQKVNN